MSREKESFDVAAGPWARTAVEAGFAAGLSHAKVVKPADATLNVACWQGERSAPCDPLGSRAGVGAVEDRGPPPGDPSAIAPRPSGGGRIGNAPCPDRPSRFPPRTVARRPFSDGDGRDAVQRLGEQGFLCNGLGAV